MKQPITIIAIAMAISIGVWTLNPAPAVAERFSANTGLKASAHVSGVVIGKTVRNEKGVVLGTIENIVLNDSGCAQYVILSGKFSGARSRLYPMPWTVIAGVAPDVILVDLDPAFLVEAPSFQRNSRPDFSESQWQTKIHNYYQRKAEAPVPGQGGKTPSVVGSEEKAKVDKRVKAKQKGWGGQATEGAVQSDQKMKEKERLRKEVEPQSSGVDTQGAVQSQGQNLKDKAHMERQIKPKPSGVETQSDVQSSKQRGMDTKTKQNKMEMP